MDCEIGGRLQAIHEQISHNLWTVTPVWLIAPSRGALGGGGFEFPSVAPLLTLV